MWSIFPNNNNNKNPFLLDETSWNAGFHLSVGSIFLSVKWEFGGEFWKAPSSYDLLQKQTMQLMEITLFGLG